MRIVALIPARAGSRRVPGKNIKQLGGKPLLHWTIRCAQESGLFDTVAVSTDDREIAIRAIVTGASAIARPDAMATDDSPDIEWVRHAIGKLKTRPDAFCILRPTSPFRSVETLHKAHALFRRCADCADSLRAVRLVTEHPGKMWTVDERIGVMKPLIPNLHPDGTPWHSSPTQTLPPYYIQTASFEFSWTSNLEAHGTISGRKVVPFITEGIETLDINTPEDFARAERHAATLLARV